MIGKNGILYWNKLTVVKIVPSKEKDKSSTICIIIPFKLYNPELLIAEKDLFMAYLLNGIQHKLIELDLSYYGVCYNTDIGSLVRLSFGDTMVVEITISTFDKKTIEFFKKYVRNI